MKDLLQKGYTLPGTMREEVQEAIEQERKRRSAEDTQ